jgi:hypothetical protein
MPRNFTGDTELTFSTWNEPRVQPLVGKHLGTVTEAQLKEFCQLFPGLDKRDGAARDYAGKIMQNQWLPESKQATAALRACPAEHRDMFTDYDKYAEANGRVPWSTVARTGDYHALWVGLRDYEAWRKRVAGYSGDNGWYKHGARLLCRAQAFYVDKKIRCYKSRAHYHKRKLGSGGEGHAKLTRQSFEDMLETGDWAPAPASVILLV